MRLVYILAALVAAAFVFAGRARAADQPQFVLRPDGTVEQRVAKVEGDVEKLTARIADLERQLGNVAAKPKGEPVTWVFSNVADMAAWRNNNIVQGDPLLLKAFTDYESVVLNVFENRVEALASTAASPRLTPIPGDFAKLFEGYKPVAAPPAKAKSPMSAAPAKVRYSVCVGGRCTVYEADAGSPIPAGATLLSGASASAAGSPCPTGGCGDACGCVSSGVSSSSSGGWYLFKNLGRRR